MATPGPNTQSSNTILRPIESNMRWIAGPVTYNIVTLDNADELEQFNALLPEGNTAMEMDFPAIWTTEFAQAFAVYNELINLELQFSNDINAVFLIGQDTGEQGSLGFSDVPREHGPGDNLIQGYNLTDPSGTTDAEIGGGSDRFHTIVHEVAHSVGLSHPHSPDEGSTSTGAADEMQPAPYQIHQTVLSYTPAPDVPGPNEEGAYQFGYAVSPMALDIAALHNMYGANMATRTGDSTYTLTDAGTAVLDNTGNTISVGRAYYSIWDAGTTDTDTITYGGVANALINLNTATLANTPTADVTQVIQQLQDTAEFNALSAQVRNEITDNTVTAGGFFSSILDADGNRIQGGYSIANGVVIENATGGQGNDYLIGNSADNMLQGNGGNDLILGGAGTDMARFSGDLAAYTLAEAGQEVTATGADGADRLIGVEALRFDDTFVFFDERRISAEKAQTVAYLYEAGLNRDGNIDSAGLNFWIDAREQGQSDVDIAQFFLDSPEFASVNMPPATLSNRQLVESLYSNVLNRPGEASGVDFWTNAADSPGFSRAELLLAFAVSPENIMSSPTVSSLAEVTPGTWDFMTVA